MQPMRDHTHDPAARSWVPGADDPTTDFPIQNLPHAVFRRRGSTEDFRGGIGIGHFVLDLAQVAERAGLNGSVSTALAAARADTLNGLMALGEPHWIALRHALFAALASGSVLEKALTGALVPLAEAEFALPARIGDFTDFYASIHHATQVGQMLRPDRPLMPNYKFLPVAYHGRSSSVVVSGTAVARPSGQWRPGDAEIPSFGPSRRLDYELELGLFIGPGNPLGRPVPVAEAEAQIFGACLLNDWSARDIQGFEYQPLGPFLGKNFATSLSPWVVTAAALRPFRIKFLRPADDPPLFTHLALGESAAWAGIDIHLDVSLQTASMRARNLPPHRIAGSHFRHAYWAAAQMIAHHTSNGCNLRPGDLLGSGTLSGPEPGERGSLLEITEGGRKPFTLPGGEQRRFIEDGDTISMRAWCEAPGARRIGFGTCEGTVRQAQEDVLF